MSEDIDQKLKEILAYDSRFTKIGGGLVPFADPSGRMIDHLFINLSCLDFNDNFTVRMLAEELRRICLRVFEVIYSELDNSLYRTIVVSIFTPISENENIRIYRTRIESVHLNSLTKENYRQQVMGEESRNRDLMAFLLEAETDRN